MSGPRSYVVSTAVPIRRTLVSAPAEFSALAPDVASAAAVEPVTAPCVKIFILWLAWSYL